MKAYSPWSSQFFSRFCFQSLVMVFAHLVHTQMEAVLDFLSSVPGPTGKPALEFVLTEWCSKQHLFYGAYEGKVRLVETKTQGSCVRPRGWKQDNLTESCRCCCGRCCTACRDPLPPLSLAPTASTSDSNPPSRNCAAFALIKKKVLTHRTRVWIGTGVSFTLRVLTAHSQGVIFQQVGWSSCLSFSFSCVALAKLLQHAIQNNDSRLQEIQVKGDPIHCNGDSGIKTRSKSVKGDQLYSTRRKSAEKSLTGRRIPRQQSPDSDPRQPTPPWHDLIKRGGTLSRDGVGARPLSWRTVNLLLQRRSSGRPSRS